MPFSWNLCLVLTVRYEGCWVLWTWHIHFGCFLIDLYLPKNFYHKFGCSLSNTFSAFIFLTMWFFFIMIYDFWILNQSCIIQINTTCSCCTILFMYSWVCCASVYENLESMFVIRLACSFLLTPLSAVVIRVIFASETWLRNIPLVSSETKGGGLISGICWWTHLDLLLLFSKLH